MAEEAVTTIEEQGTQTVEPTKPQEIKSGMNSIKKRYEQKAPESKPSGEQTEESPKKYDYSVFKDLNEDDYKKYENLKEKDEASYYEILSHRNDMKKNQRLVAEREREIKDLRSKITTPEDVEKMKQFVNGLKEDALGTYKRFQKDFDLPDPEFLEKQIVSGGSVEDHLTQWQEKNLIPDIEKKFKIEEGTFVYDANEAFKSGTPSYEFRVRTQEKENALLSEYRDQKQRQTEIVTKVKQQNDVDMQFLRETYFPDNKFAEFDEQGNIVNAEEARKKADEAFIQTLNQLDEIQRQNREGEFNPETNPFSLRVIWRGINHDQLVKEAVEAEVKKVHAAYSEKGIYLQNGKESPTDPTQVKGSPAITQPEKKQYGMLHKTVQRSLRR